MHRSIPWTIAVLALVAFGASLSQVHKARERYWNLVRFQSHDHMHSEIRQFMIRVALSDAERPIVVIGDSITEMSRLPETIDGHPVINAGIGGATIEDFQGIASDLLANSNPTLIAVALGANNGNLIQETYAALLSHLKTLSPRLLAVGLTPQDGADVKNPQIKVAAQSQGVAFLGMPLPEGSTISDHVHLNAAGYRTWVPKLVAAISALAVR